MSVFSHLAALNRRRFSVFGAVLVLPLLALLSGCDKDDDEQVMPASSVEYSTASRPTEIVESYTALQGGQPAQAYSSAHGFLQSQPNSPYRPEAQYLCGQALAAQGDFERAKKFQEEAVDNAPNRNLKALAMLGRADCNYGLGNFSLASRQYHWIVTMYKDVKPLHQDEAMFKLGMAAKKANNREWADYWFNQVNELYNTGPYAERARAENSNFNPPPNANKPPLVYSLEAYSFSNQERADEAAAALRSKGYRDVEVIPTTRVGNPVFEVHVGKFTSRAEAGRAQVDAKLAGLSTSVRPGTVEPIK